MEDGKDGKLLQKLIEAESWAVVALKRLDKKYTLNQLRKAIGMIIVAAKEGITILREKEGE